MHCRPSGHFPPERTVQDSFQDSPGQSVKRSDLQFYFPVRDSGSPPRTIAVPGTLRFLAAALSLERIIPVQLMQVILAGQLGFVVSVYYVISVT